MTPERTIVFVCLHGAAKSVLAAAYLRRLAARRGLAATAVARGTEPDPEIAPRVVTALLADGIDLRGERPRGLTRTDLGGAWRVVSFGCELEALAPPRLPIERWDDVPAVSADLDAARAAIVARVERLTRRVPFQLDSPNGGKRRRKTLPTDPLAQQVGTARAARRAVMKWVTRERARVDRIACPWLITRFIDRDAEFLFVPPGQVAEVAAREKATPFDVEGADLGHHGAECSFDAFLRVYRLEDAALGALARIVRGADTEARDLTPESWGLYAVASGFREIARDDHDNMARQFPVYDALYAYCRARIGAGGR